MRCTSGCRSTTSTPGARSRPSRGPTRCSPRPSGTASPATPTTPRWRPTTCSPAPRPRSRAREGRPGAESRFNLGDLAYDEAFPDSGADEWLVINTLPQARTVLVEEPEVRAGGAPRGMLDMFFPRDVPWGGARSLEHVRVARAELPACGWAWVRFDGAPDASDLAVAPGVIENAHYRVEIDPATGGLRSWVDKELGHDFAGEQDGHRIGQYVYERVEGDRRALFADNFSEWDFGVWPEDVPLRRAVAGAGDRRRAGDRGRARHDRGVDRGRGRARGDAAGSRSRAAPARSRSTGRSTSSPSPTRSRSTSRCRSRSAPRGSGPISTASPARRTRTSSRAACATGTRCAAGSTCPTGSAASRSRRSTRRSRSSAGSPPAAPRTRSSRTAPRSTHGRSTTTGA